jgi:hypothetical protein
MLIELCDKIIDCIDLLVIRYFINDFNRFCKIFKIWWTYSSLKFNDVQVKEQFFILHIHKSKTDLYRQGNAISMSKLTSVVCHVYGIWGGATYLEIFLSWWFSRLHIMWIYHCNVGKTKRLKKNVKENIWCHQKMNRKNIWKCSCGVPFKLHYETDKFS